MLGASQSGEEHHAASCSMEGMGPSLVVEGATNRELFQTYVKQILASTLGRGQVVMDNLTVHKGERVRDLIEGQGCELIYLPPYSTGFQPHRGGIQQDQRLDA